MGEGRSATPAGGRLAPSAGRPGPSGSNHALTSTGKVGGRFVPTSPPTGAVVPEPTRAVLIEIAGGATGSPFAWRDRAGGPFRGQRAPWCRISARSPNSGSTPAAEDAGEQAVDRGGGSTRTLAESGGGRAGSTGTSAARARTQQLCGGAANRVAGLEGGTNRGRFVAFHWRGRTNEGRGGAGVGR